MNANLPQIPFVVQVPNEPSFFTLPATTANSSFLSHPVNGHFPLNGPLPVNALQMNRNARGMDKGVQRLDFSAVNAYQLGLADSLIDKEKTTKFFLDFNPNVSDVLSKIFITQSHKFFDEDWHNDSVDYVNNLSNKDKFMLRAYTRNGDELINTLLRTPEKFVQLMGQLVSRAITKNGNNVIAVQIFQIMGIDPEKMITRTGKITADGFIHLINYTATMPMDEIKRHILQLAEEIRRIIRAAPRPSKPLRLYRGIKNDYVGHNNAENVQLSGFQSMSYSIRSALGFAGNYNETNLQSHSMLYTFTIGPDVPCIAMESISHFEEENEILVDMNLFAHCEPEFEERIEVQQSNYNYYSLQMVNSYPLTSIYKKDIIVFGEGGARRGFRNARHSITNNMNMTITPHMENNYGNYVNNSQSQLSNNSQLNAAINSALNKSYQYGGRLNINRTRRNGRNGRNVRNNINKNLMKMAKGMTRRNNAKMNTQMNSQPPTREQAIALMKQIEETERKENDYRKVRDPGLGFVIVKDVKLSPATKKMINDLKEAK